MMCRVSGIILMGTDPSQVSVYGVLCLFVGVALHISPSLCTSVHISPSLCTSVHFFIHLSISLHFFVHLSTSLHFFVHLSTSFSPSLCTSVHLWQVEGGGGGGGGGVCVCVCKVLGCRGAIVLGCRVLWGCSSVLKCYLYP